LILRLDRKSPVHKPKIIFVVNTTFTPFPVLTTERLNLRQLATNDEREIFILRSDIEVNKYLERPISNTVDDARKFISKVNENIERNESLYWAITLTGKNSLVGTVCLFGFSGENSKCEIGFELLPGFQGQGIMKEAVDKVISYAFKVIRVKEIEAFVHKDNQRSIKLLERILFKSINEPHNANPDLVCYHLIGTLA
jgi:[ribosomal protein S5]-alanine N-acetyltransferase